MKSTECMTVREVADILKVNPITIYDYIRLRKLPAFRIGRYYRVLVSDFESFIEQQKMT
jgi:excisionase family DNA binding protein